MTPHDPTGHNGNWTGFDERVENRWKHSGCPAGQMDSPIVCSDCDHLSCPGLFHGLCAVDACSTPVAKLAPLKGWS
jgi:hypothetical protein